MAATSIVPTDNDSAAP